MRRTFRRHRKQLATVAIVARKPAAERLAPQPRTASTGAFAPPRTLGPFRNPCVTE